MVFREIASGVYQIPLGIVSCYMVGNRDTWTLVDAGTENKEDIIMAAALECFGGDSVPEAIVLTHGHFDHAGSAAALADTWEVPILAHPMELPYVDGRSAYPPPDPTVGGFMAQVIRLYGNRRVNLADRVEPLDPDEDLPGMEGWEIIETPGHTPGHCSFYRHDDRVLIAGDAFSTVNQDNPFDMLSQKKRVWRPPPYYTCDWEEAEISVRRLASLRPNVLAAGHGQPMSGREATDQLRRLSRNFPIPEKGRYVAEPVKTDENGIVYLPPAPPDPLKWTALTVGAAALAGASLLVARNRRKENEFEELNRAA